MHWTPEAGRGHGLAATDSQSFANLVAGGVPWGSRERAAEMTKLMAAHRYAGPASTYYTIAPDGVHNPTTIRWSHPFVGQGVFPHVEPVGWRAALQAQDPAARCMCE